MLCSFNLFLLLCRLYSTSILQLLGNNCKVHIVCFAFIKQMKCFPRLIDLKNNNVLRLIKQIKLILKKSLKMYLE